MTKSKLNLGCGNDVKRGYINLDVCELKGVDVVHDLSKFPYPFKENTFDEILCNYVIELIKGDLIEIIEELYRISKSKGIVIIRSPCFPNPNCTLDPHTERFISFNSFDIFINGVSYNYYTTARFKMIKRRFIFSLNKKLNWISYIINMFPMFYSRFLFFYLPSNVVEFELEVIK